MLEYYRPARRAIHAHRDASGRIFIAALTSCYSTTYTSVTVGAVYALKPEFLQETLRGTYAGVGHVISMLGAGTPLADILLLSSIFRQCITGV